MSLKLSCAQSLPKNGAQSPISATLGNNALCLGVVPADVPLSALKHLFAIVAATPNTSNPDSNTSTNAGDASGCGVVVFTLPPCKLARDASVVAGDAGGKRVHVWALSPMYHNSSPGSAMGCSPLHLAPVSATLSLCALVNTRNAPRAIAALPPALHTHYANSC